MGFSQGKVFLLHSENSIRLILNEMKNIHWVDCVLNQEIYGDMKFSVQPDKIHCRPGEVITVFVSFKVGKPPINIVFFIYRVFNNGSYPIVFSINSYVSQSHSGAANCTLYSQRHQGEVQ